MNTDATTIRIQDLPAVVTGYLAAHRARDAEAALSFCAPDVEITDEGHTYRGAEEITAWMRRTSARFTYTSEVTGAQRLDDEHFVAVHHLVGDFPGSPVDLGFTITLDDDRITRVVIA
jgi:ketosteroid isomerase-like protein